MTSSDCELLQSKNLGMATVNILRAIGINTFEQLREAGAVHAYRKIKERDIHVSKVMLYALYGAINDQPWQELDQATKEALVAEAEQTEEIHFN